MIPGELLDHDLPCLKVTARALHIPAGELRHARGDEESQVR